MKNKEPVTPKQIAEAVLTAKREAKDPYAQIYLNALPLAAEEYGSEGVLVQLMYAMGNLGTWRGEKARECKDIIKRFLKQNGK
jgi:hypothetical protein